MLQLFGCAEGATEISPGLLAQHKSYPGNLLVIWQRINSSPIRFAIDEGGAAFASLQVGLRKRQNNNFADYAYPCGILLGRVPVLGERGFAQDQAIE